MMDFSTHLVNTANLLGRKAAFLDRDGVINVDHGYVSRWEDFEFHPGSIEGMKLLLEAGYLLVIVTNQSGIARGYFTEDDYWKLTTAYRSCLAGHGVTIDAIYHCPHHPDFLVRGQPECCHCRKPRPGLIIKAAIELNIQLSDSLLVGDKLSDIQAAHLAGIPRRYLLSCNSDKQQSDLEFRPYSVCSSLLRAARHACQAPAIASD